jgi:hypothetical protein
VEKKRGSTYKRTDIQDLGHKREKDISSSRALWVAFSANLSYESTFFFFGLGLFAVDLCSYK